MIKSPIGLSMQHEEILQEKMMEPLRTRYIKKIMIYLMDTQYIPHHHVHTTEMTKHLTGISCSLTVQTRMETSIRRVRLENQANFQYDSIQKCYSLDVDFHIADMIETKLELPLENIIHHLQIISTWPWQIYVFRCMLK